MFTVRDREYDGYAPRNPPRWRDAKRYGRVYLYDKGEVELFTVRVLAEALDRSSDTLISWEKDGLLPKPVYQVTGGKHLLRFYSGSQVLNLNRLFIVKYRGLKHLEKAGRARNPERLRQFYRDLRHWFYVLETISNNEPYMINHEDEKDADS